MPMPNYLHHTFDGGGIAIWHITESASELYTLLDTHAYDARLSTITHEGRRAEWLAVRLLVAHVLGRDKEVAYHPTGRPYLTDGSYQISISHTRGYAAIAYHPTARVGLDIEYRSSRVERIAHRFTHPSEASYLDAAPDDQRPMQQLVNWSAKETLYKLFDSPSAADFQNAFAIDSYPLAEQGELTASVYLPVQTRCKVNYAFHPDFVCTWAVDSSLD